ncbi:MAG: DUF3796 domain-containing protein [Niameybacter sp.]|uniref:DUF3796 domain-containing protein n=1 Tax=Niameybacter sp. TaxID=2033640 RepID=UPI002FC58FD6
MKKKNLKVGWALGNQEIKTRTISKHLGWLGFLGFMGPIAYLTTDWTGSLAFLVFFGFFSFYFEGKMSGTLRDERYLENERRAQGVAYRVGLMIIFLSLIACVNWIEPYGYKTAYTFLIAVLALDWAVVSNLSIGLLYYWDKQEQDNE